MPRYLPTTALIWLIAMSGGVKAATVLPDFSAAVFKPGAQITNLYLPLSTAPPSVLVAEGEGDSGPFVERTERSVLGAGPEIMGVLTTTFLDRAYIDGRIVEETFDYFAQDDAGNVWYMGEDVTNYRYDDAGNLIGTDNESAWRAGVSDALPGYGMPASTTPDFAYYQEFAAADGALDEARTLTTRDHLWVDGQRFSDVLVVFESSALDPDLRELKYYAPGFGLIRVDEGIDENFRNPELVFNIVNPAPVPLPAGLPLALAGLGALIVPALRKRRTAR